MPGAPRVGHRRSHLLPLAKVALDMSKSHLDTKEDHHFSARLWQYALSFCPHLSLHILDLQNVHCHQYSNCCFSYPIIMIFRVYPFLFLYLRSQSCWVCLHAKLQLTNLLEIFLVLHFPLGDILFKMRISLRALKITLEAIAVFFLSVML